MQDIEDETHDTLSALFLPDIMYSFYSETTKVAPRLDAFSIIDQLVLEPVYCIARPWAASFYDFFNQSIRTHFKKPVNIIFLTDNSLVTKRLGDATFPLHVAIFKACIFCEYRIVL